MTPVVRTLSGREALDPALGPAWDALAPGRAEQADLYDTRVWLAAWSAVNPVETARLRVPAVLDGNGRPLALLPLVARGTRAWEAAGIGYRPRFRVIIGTAQPDEAVLDGLAAELARTAVRELTLPAMPARDPATDTLAAALGRAGFEVTRREGSSECLARVEDGWAGHRARFKKFERTARNFANKAQRVGPVVLDAFGGPGHPPVLEGFGTYLAVHAHGWKGPLGETMAAHRRELLRGAGERGWARLYVLRVAGVPAAAIAWFRVGEVAIAYSTVYDQRLAAISAGTVVMWQSHEQVFGEAEPRLVDLLPGHGSQKDQLGPDRPPLVTLRATRGAAWYGWWRAGTRRAAAARERLARAVRPRGDRPARAGDREREFAPRPDPAWSVRPVAVEARLEIVLAVAGAHSSPAAMTSSWDEGDRWFAVESGLALALVRVGTSGKVQEVVLPDNEPGVEVPPILAPVLGALAAELGRPLSARPGAIVRFSPFALR